MLAAWAFSLLFLPAAADWKGVQQALDRGEPKAALADLEKIPADTARWHLLASRAYDALNDPARAVAEAEAALQLDPKDPAHHVQLAQIFLSRNTPQAALDIFTEAQAQFPEVFMIRLGRALALKNLQRYQEAEGELKWCLNRQPAAPLPFDALSTIYLQLSKYAELRTLSESFLKNNPADYRGYYFLAAAADGESESADELVRTLQLSIGRNPSFAASHALMGKVLLRANQPADAARSLERAVALRPGLVQAHLQLARAYRALGKEAAANQEFETVRRLKVKEQEPVPSLRYHRGRR